VFAGPGLAVLVASASFHEENRVAFTTPQRRPQSGARALSVGTLVAGLTGGFTIVAIMGLIGGPLAGLDTVSADTRLRIAFGLLILVALMSGFVVAVWRSPAGLVAALLTGLSAAMLLWLMRTLLLEGRPYNPLVFGPPGLIAVVLAATAGGWIAHILDDDRLHTRFAISRAAQVGLWAACLWLSFELVARLAGGAGLGPAIGNALAGEVVGVLFGMLAAAWVIARYGQANGISIGDWEYRWSPTTIAIGAMAGLLALGLMWLTAQIDMVLWGIPEEAMTVFAEGLQAGAWVAILLLIANSLVAPVCEEIAWRGVIQTAFVRAWGPWVGIGVTVLVFAMKHVVLDGTFARITTLLMLGLVFGVVRHRWGTGSSTVTHVLVNLYSTGVLIASV
jgi:membrane protease YdiL (CAAX protease family)